MGQLLLQLLEKVLAQWRVFHLGIAVSGECRNLPDIIGLHAVLGVLLQQPVGIADFFGKQYGMLLMMGSGLFPKTAGHAFVAELEIKQPPEQRHCQDQDDPGDLIGGVVIFGGQPHDDGQTKQLKRSIDVSGEAADIKQQDHGNGDLQDNQQRKPKNPTDQKAQYFFHLHTLLPGNDSSLFYIIREKVSNRVKGGSIRCQKVLQ